MSRVSQRRFTLTAGLVAVAIVVGLFLVGVFAQLASASTANLALAPPSGSLTPGASGKVQFTLSAGRLSGMAEVQSLPAQGSGLAYVLWFVNTATGDKAFLGPLVEDGTHTILFHNAGNGEVTFAASSFTSGPDSGSPISFASAGNNLFIVLVENNINFASPSPTGVAVSATF